MRMRDGPSSQTCRGSAFGRGSRTDSHPPACPCISDRHARVDVRSRILGADDARRRLCPDVARRESASPDSQIAAHSPEFDAIACRMQGMLESGVPQPAKRGAPGDFFRTSVFQFFADDLSVWVPQTVRFIRRSCVWARRRRVKVGVNWVARSVACVPRFAIARSSRHFVTSPFAFAQDTRAFHVGRR